MLQAASAVESTTASPLDTGLSDAECLAAYDAHFGQLLTYSGVCSGQSFLTSDYLPGDTSHDAAVDVAHIKGGGGARGDAVEGLRPESNQLSSTLSVCSVDKFTMQQRQPHYQNAIVSEPYIMRTLVVMRDVERLSLSDIGRRQKHWVEP